jgi:hypothetical protein
MYSKSRWSSTMTYQRKVSIHFYLFLLLTRKNRNRENYIHRIGRSGRFGRKGVAINVRPYGCMIFLRN